MDSDDMSPRGRGDRLRPWNLWIVVPAVSLMLVGGGMLFAWTLPLPAFVGESMLSAAACVVVVQLLLEQWRKDLSTPAAKQKRRAVASARVLDGWLERSLPWFFSAACLAAIASGMLLFWQGVEDFGWSTRVGRWW